MATPEDPAELAGRVDLIFTCVSADADVPAVFDRLLPALGAGQVLVDRSTVDADTAREAARRIAASGAAFFDAPVSGGQLVFWKSAVPP